MLLTWGPGAAGVVHTPLTAAFMREHKRAALEPYPSLWTMALRLLDAAVARGLLPP